MINLAQYVGVHKDSPDWTPERKLNAEKLLAAIVPLEAEMLLDGVVWKVNPKTGSQISGETLGGFRPQSCTIGAPKSSHKQGLAVDVYDPDGKIDEWIMKNQQALVNYGLYIEHPDATKGWCHLTIKAPGSGRRVFYP